MAVVAAPSIKCWISRIGNSDRSPRGVRPTTVGLDLIEHAARVEEEFLAASRRVEGHDSQISGVVRLSTPEAFGTYFIAPRSHLLNARHQQIELELAPESRNVNLSKREADIAISLHRPDQGRCNPRG